MRKPQDTKDQLQDRTEVTINIKVFIKIADDRLLDYKLEVTGEVYGDTPHICEK